MKEFPKVPISKYSISNRRLICGVGINDSQYMVSVKTDNGVLLSPAYDRWNSMFTRCYSDKYQKIGKTYMGCSVAKEWHTFTNFERWFDKNYVEGFRLDKDIKFKDNKIYSPDTCLFIPDCINKLLTGDRVVKGDYPQGVNIHKRNGKFISRVNIDGKRKYLGLFLTPELASEAYVNAKNSEILRKCEQYPELKKYLLNHII